MTDTEQRDNLLAMRKEITTQLRRCRTYLLNSLEIDRIVERRPSTIGELYLCMSAGGWDIVDLHSADFLNAIHPRT